MNGGDQFLTLCALYTFLARVLASWKINRFPHRAFEDKVKRACNGVRCNQRSSLNSGSVLLLDSINTRIIFKHNLETVLFVCTSPHTIVIFINELIYVLYIIIILCIRLYTIINVYIYIIVNIYLV